MIREYNLSKLSFKTFNGTSIEWLDMIIQCRSNPNYQHKYDIVIEKIANDNVGKTVSYVLQGIMRKEAAIAPYLFFFRFPHSSLATYRRTVAISIIASPDQVILLGSPYRTQPKK